MSESTICDEFKRALEGVRKRRAIVCSPANLARLQESLEACGVPTTPLTPLDRLCGIPISSHPMCPDTEPQPTGRVLFPEDRFVEYGPEDEEWAIKLGFATPETEERLVFYEVAMPWQARMFVEFDGHGCHG